MHKLIVLGILFLVWGCQSANKPNTGDVLQQPWSEIEKKARGTTVNLMMWTGDPLINAYMQNYVVPNVKKRLGIDLKIASGQGNLIVQALLAELQAGKTESELDLLWINGETFYQLREINALFGPWTDKLPNAQYINLSNPFIGIDFQQPVDGFECPWGNVQMALIYNSDQVPNPPQDPQALAAFLKEHPGKFTFDNQFTGMTFLKSLLIDIAGGAKVLEGGFDEKKYLKYSQELWAYLKSIQPYLWRAGKTFPENVAVMHQLYASGELWFTMSNNDNEVDNKVTQGLFPASSRAYVWKSGLIQNTHYQGIPQLSKNKAGAMAVVNFLISPEAQLKKQDPAVWGDGIVLDVKKLPQTWQAQWQKLPPRKYVAPRSELNARALPELAPQYMIRLAEDFRKNIIEQ